MRPDWLWKIVSRLRPGSGHSNQIPRHAVSAQRPPGFPDWAALISKEKGAWSDALARASTGRRVLIATNIGGHVPVNIMESLLALALTWRGARVTTLLCDGVLPGC